jgi:hypothetical protein
MLLFTPFPSALAVWLTAGAVVMFVTLLVMGSAAETKFGGKVVLLLLGSVVGSPTAANSSVWVMSSSLVLSTADRAVGAAMGFGPAVSVTLLLLDTTGSAACLKPREVL